MNYPTDETRIIGWSFGLQWVIATTLGVVISVLMSAMIGLKFSALPLAFLTLTGTIVGVTQWVVLKRVIPRAVWWIPASFIGSYIGACTWWVSSLRWEIISSDLNTFISLLIYGAIVGSVQWAVLKQCVSKAFRWILLSAIGLTASFFIPALVAVLLPSPKTYSDTITWTIPLVINGLLQAIALVWLLRQNAQEH